MQNSRIVLRWFLNLIVHFLFETAKIIKILDLIDSSDRKIINVSGINSQLLHSNFFEQDWYFWIWLSISFFFLLGMGLIFWDLKASSCPQMLTKDFKMKCTNQSFYLFMYIWNLSLSLSLSLYIYIYIYIYICIYIYIYISSSRTDCTDFSDSFFQSVFIIHCSQQVFQTTSCVRTELMWISSSWLANTGTSMCCGL